MHFDLDWLGPCRVDPMGDGFQICLSCFCHGLGLRCRIALQRNQKLHNEQNILLAGECRLHGLVHGRPIFGFRCPSLDLQEGRLGLRRRGGWWNVRLGWPAGLRVERALIDQLAASQQGSHQQDTSRQKKGTWSHDASKGTKIAENCSHIVRDRRRNGGFGQD